MAIADAFALASVDATRWTPALTLLASSTGSRAAELLGLGSATTPGFYLSTENFTISREDFLAIDGYNPAINFRIAASIDASPMEIVDERRNRTAQSLLVREDYRDFCRDADIPFGCHTTLSEGANGLVGLSILRGLDDGETSEEQRGVFQQTALHVRTAVAVQSRLGQDAAALAMEAFDTMQAAAFVCDHMGFVCSYSLAASLLLTTGALRLEGRRLSHPWPGQNDVLGTAIAAASASEHRQTAARVLLPHVHPNQYLSVDVITLPRRPSGLSFEPRVLVMVRSPSTERSDGARLLRMAFDLSPAEADVAIALARGICRDEVAVIRGVGIGTIRAQMKIIYQKLDVRRESDLISLVRYLIA